MTLPTSSFGISSDGVGAIVIFGAGVHGNMAYQSLRNRGRTVHCFCDNDVSKQGSTFCGLPVLAPSALKNIAEADIFIAATFFQGISQQLTEMGLGRFHDCLDLFSDTDLEKWHFDMPRERLRRHIDLYRYSIPQPSIDAPLVVKSLDVVVTEKCSLRCRDCANLMQFYVRPVDCDKEVLFAALDRFMAAVHRLGEFRVLGGEALLARGWTTVIERLLSFEHCERTVVYTNGTILPEDRVFDLLCNAKIAVDITNYGVLSRKFEEWTRRMDHLNIPYTATTSGLWQDCGRIERQNETPQERALKFINCCARDTFTLLHGRLYRCPFAAHAENLGAIPIVQEDRVDLMESEDDVECLRSRLVRFCAIEEGIYACRYCFGRDYSAGKVPAAIQTRKPLPYQVLEKK